MDALEDRRLVWLGLIATATAFVLWVFVFRSAAGVSLFSIAAVVFVYLLYENGYLDEWGGSTSDR